MKKLFLIIFILIILISCKKDGNSYYETLLRFQYIEIPAYSYDDYKLLLNNKNNPEIIYNSICNLLYEADRLGRILSKEDQKDSETYKNANENYNKILSLLKLKDDKITVSIISFLTLLGNDYKNKEELIKILLNIRSNKPYILFEKVKALSVLSKPETNIDTDYIVKMLNNKSWLVSRSTYELVNALENAEVRSILIKKYKEENLDYEKLLILKAFEKNFNEEVFELFKFELINSKDKSIKYYISKLLENAKDTELVINWLTTSYDFSEEDFISIINNYYNLSTKFSTNLFLTLINKGFNPIIDFYDEKNTARLYYYLLDDLNDFEGKTDLEDEDKLKLERLKQIEASILSSEVLKADWLEYKDRKIEISYSKEFMREYNENLDDYINKTKKLFYKNNILFQNELFEEYMKKLMKYFLISDIRKDNSAD